VGSYYFSSFFNTSMNRKILYITSAALALPTLAIALAASAASPVSFSSAWAGHASALTAEQQQTLQQARGLREQGKNDEAKTLLEKAGIPKPSLGKGRGHSLMNPAIHQNRQAVHETVVNNDFAKFQELTNGTPFGDKIDAAGFAKLVQAQQLRTSGDLKGARTIMKELFPNARLGQGPHGGQRFHKPNTTNTTKEANK